eukprot:5923838-Heterocapsa_arctica.AAC.1
MQIHWLAQRLPLPQPLPEVVPKPHRRRNQRHGVRDSYTPHQPGRGEDCSAHQISFSAESESDEYNGMPISPDQSPPDAHEIKYDFAQQQASEEE